MDGTTHIFNTSAFNRLNEARCDEVLYLLFRDTKVRCGIILGSRKGMLMSPFSAPFGGFSFTSKDTRISVLDTCMEALMKFVKDQGYKGLRFVLPPLLKGYGISELAKTLNVVYRNDFKIRELDLDYNYNLSIAADYEQYLWRNARKNLNTARSEGLSLQHGRDVSLLPLVYEIIRENRTYTGKPLNMSLEEISRTASVVSVDFFLVWRGAEAVASAVIYHVAEGTAYIPFWADRPAHRECRAINFLTAELVDHYAKLGYRDLHIGISTEKSIPNHGLCEFKESTGAQVLPRFIFEKHFDR